MADYSSYCEHNVETTYGHCPKCAERERQDRHAELTHGKKLWEDPKKTLQDSLDRQILATQKNLDTWSKDCQKLMDAGNFREAYDKIASGPDYLVAKLSSWDEGKDMRALGKARYPGSRY